MGDCIIWTGGTGGNGYGKKKVDGVMRYAHRLAWEEVNGPIPDDMCVCHTCDVPACVNVEHLFLGTHTDNMRDKVAKGRNRNGKERDHCKHGHAYDEENTLMRKDRPGHRECRTCRRQADARSREGSRLG